MENNLFRINEVVLKNSGEIKYNYSFGKAIAKYFAGSSPFYTRYESVDISIVPEHILIIPFLSQLLPVSWFAGFDIEVEALDRTFYNAMIKVKTLHLKTHSQQVKPSRLIVQKLVDDNRHSDRGALLLYSGGVDSVFSFLQHRHEKPDVVSILGADISLDNPKLWEGHKQITIESPILSEAKKFFIESNLRNFYSYQVPLLIPDKAWWGRVQHGLGLTGLLAPLTWLNGYTQVLIASTYSSDISVNWGSTADKDNMIKWNGTSVVHDALQTKRIDKIRAITQFADASKESIILRVCYASKNTSINCSHCEKCYRTILGLMINGADPAKFGFKVSEEIYDEVISFVNKGFLASGEAYFWNELATAIEEKHLIKMQGVSTAIIREINKGLRKPKALTMFRQKIQLMFPRLTRQLIRLRNKF